MNPILMAAIAAALAGGPVPEAERPPLPVREKTKHDLERIRKAQEKRERKLKR